VRVRKNAIISSLRGSIQNEHAPLAVRDLHHEDVTSMSNLEMIPELILHSIVQLEPCKMWPYAMS
jgi:hypothetical protein